MKIVCPCCAAEFPLEAAMSDVSARQAIARAFSLTPLGDVLLPYVGLFKPAKQALKMPVLVRILDELLVDIKAGQITLGGTIYPAPQEYWRSAIETMLASRDTLILPLKSHGYLYKIIASFGNRAAAAQERKSEQGRKYGAIQTAADHIAHTEPVKTTRNTSRTIGGVLKEITGKVQQHGN
ncbi:MAG: hypothetical protein Q8J66_09270 [Methylotenera sp.]|nr:hypothetical protein [Methylotenera sp.]